LVILGTADGVHKCYAAGFSWKENGYLKHTSFWGLCAITKSMVFHYDNRFKFKEHTFFTHDGGFYDIGFLFREGFLTDDRFQIDSCIEQDVGQALNVASPNSR